ncbi:MAG: hydroxymethylglutaryl-CoA lyase [Xanthomonadales bacterium]|nr:hydroxymethylglutaryl-CoA lyase [Xanthomonadales bacterium]
MSQSAEVVKIVEVGARDGLQNEKQIVPTAVKVKLIESLAESGLRHVEATSFVSPKWIPQLADAAELMAQLSRLAHVNYPVLVPNMQGYQRAVAAGAKEVAIFTAASEAFNQRNINATIDQSLARFVPIMEAAAADGVHVRGYVSTVLGCPYQGEVPLADVVRVAEALNALGCYEISLGDTIGVGTPSKAKEMFQAVAAVVPAERLAVHFHDTRGQALANIYACLEVGARAVDSSVAGLGGCPYARGATGNVATEDVVYMLEGMGLHTGVDLDALAAVGRWISDQLGRANGSKVGVALGAQQS